jgi:hypothetical protein
MLAEGDRFDAIEFGEIAIQHDSLIPDDINATIDEFFGGD